MAAKHCSKAAMRAAEGGLRPHGGLLLKCYYWSSSLIMMATRW
jgi:hypothetical protein